MTTIASELEALRDPDGLLRVERVLEAASDPNSPLHAHFEWNDGEAAHRYRIEQARTLIRAQRISVRVGPTIVRTVSYVPTAEHNGTYQSLREIPRSSDLARSVMLNELSRVAGSLGRARNIAAVLGLEAEIDDLLSALSSVRERAATAPVAETVVE